MVKGNNIYIAYGTVNVKGGLPIGILKIMMYSGENSPWKCLKKRLQMHSIAKLKKHQQQLVLCTKYKDVSYMYRHPLFNKIQIMC